jgi:hypothetical protein
MMNFDVGARGETIVPGLRRASGREDLLAKAG